MNLHFLGDCFGWMERDCGSWFPERHFDWQSPNLNSVSARLDLGQQQSYFSAYINRCTNMVIPNGTLPISAFAELPQLPAGNANEPHGWFYCLPRFRQAFTPMPTSTFKEKLLVGPHGNSKEAVIPDSGSGCAQKSFLVFDQTGDQTTMIFSPGIGAPVHCQTSWNPKLPSCYNLIGNEPGIKRESIYHAGQSLTDELNEDHGTDVGSEMHEDTEELNALLYSDDDSDEDDDVTSTGHTPSTMTFHDKQDWFEGSAEEVASSDGATKSPKLFERGFEVPSSLIDTASSAKRKRSQFSEYEDDAQSSCANVKYPCPDEIDFFSGNKRMKRERIRETVSILQRIIPGAKGKDATDVLDEAIVYLKSLKLKAKTLGLDSL